MARAVAHHDIFIIIIKASARFDRHTACRRENISRRKVSGLFEIGNMIEPATNASASQ